MQVVNIGGELRLILLFLLALTKLSSTSAWLSRSSYRTGCLLSKSYIRQTEMMMLLNLPPPRHQLGHRLSDKSWQSYLNTLMSTSAVTWRRVVPTLTIAGSFLLGNVAPSIAGEWNDRNRLAAETWRTVDQLYMDRTFNGQDWFKLRQSIVKKTYESDDAVYTAIKDMLSKLGDKYTRYLPPSQYEALMGSAQGQLIGIGVELGTREGECRLSVV